MGADVAASNVADTGIRLHARANPAKTSKRDPHTEILLPMIFSPSIGNLVVLID
jgi:hypothetical protein